MLLRVASSVSQQQQDDFCSVIKMRYVNSIMKIIYIDNKTIRKVCRRPYLVRLTLTSRIQSIRFHNESDDEAVLIRLVRRATV